MPVCELHLPVGSWGLCIGAGYYEATVPLTVVRQ